MGLEYLINKTNKFYLDNNIAVIYKKPTPIKVLKINKENHITSAIFEMKSTTDYNGVYKGRYIDFEAKSTNSKTSLPLSNFKEYQLDHFMKINFHNGISFIIVEFKTLNRFFVVQTKHLFDYLTENKKKSFPLDFFIKYGEEIKLNLRIPLDYLPCIDNFFK